MTQHPSLGLDAVRVNEAGAQRILQRAIELDAVADATSISQLRQGALEAGVSPEAFHAALAESSLAGALDGAIQPALPLAHRRERTGTGWPKGWRAMLTMLAVLAGGMVAGAKLADTREEPWDQRTLSSVPDAPAVGGHGPYFEFQVEKPVMPLDNAAPQYPASLERQGISGQVIAQFVVDESGMPERQTVRVVQSSHALLAEAVEDAIPRMRFQPAEVGGRKVRQLVQHPFVFAIDR